MLRQPRSPWVFAISRRFTQDDHHPLYLPEGVIAAWPEPDLVALLVRNMTVACGECRFHIHHVSQCVTLSFMT